MSAASEVSEPGGIVETPSGKGAKDENFPVGSMLLPARLRPHVAIFYAYARAIDDIADDPDLPNDDKIERLGDFAKALEGQPGFGPEFAKAHALRASLEEMKISTVHGTDLILAFVQDCKKFRYETWDELLGYCALSANPVGRYLLDLHEEAKESYRYSDALCTVLQIINHLQDCQDDKQTLDRIYIIESWLREQGGELDAIDADASSAALRQVMDRMLDGCDDLMVDARQLPSMLKSRHLAMESAVIVRLADRLIQRLRKNDPVAERIDLSKLDFVSAGIRGAVVGFFSAGKGLS